MQFLEIDSFDLNGLRREQVGWGVIYNLKRKKK